MGSSRRPFSARPIGTAHAVRARRRAKHVGRVDHRVRRSPAHPNRGESRCLGAEVGRTREHRRVVRDAGFGKVREELVRDRVPGRAKPPRPAARGPRDRVRTVFDLALHGASVEGGEVVAVTERVVRDLVAPVRRLPELGRTLAAHEILTDREERERNAVRTRQHLETIDGAIVDRGRAVRRLGREPVDLVVERDLVEIDRNRRDAHAKPDPSAEAEPARHCPAILATSAAKSSVCFSMPSPRSKRTKRLTCTGPPACLADLGLDLLDLRARRR